MKELFEENLREKFFDILLNSDRNIVKKELERECFNHIALLEFFATKNFDEAEFQNFKREKEEEIKKSEEDFYLGLMSKILSQNS